MKPRAAFIVVNYYTHDKVRQLLKSLADHSTAATEVIVSVIDNSCNDEEWAKLRAAIDDLENRFMVVSTHRNTVNSGYAGGNNAGYMQIARHDPEVVVVVNPDVLIEQCDIDSLVRQIEAEPRSLFGAPTSTDQFSLSGLASLNTVTGKSSQHVESQRPGNHELLYPSGHFLAVSADTWMQLGGLSEDFFLFGEEADLTLRARSIFPDTSVRSLYDVQVVHERGLTSGADPDIQRKSLLTFTHATRSSIILFRKHTELSARLPAVLVARLLYSMVTLMRVGPAASAAVIKGIIGGLRWRKAVQFG